MLQKLECFVFVLNQSNDSSHMKFSESHQVIVFNKNQAMKQENDDNLDVEYKTCEIGIKNIHDERQRMKLPTSNIDRYSYSLNEEQNVFGTLGQV
jgi:hypothetical protein